MTAFNVLVSLVVAGFATWQAVDVWHHSAITASMRARWQLSNSFVARLLACPYCLSVWVGVLFSVWMTAFFLLPRGSDFGLNLLGSIVYETVVIFFGAIPLGLATSKLANLCNDSTRSLSRLPKHDQEDGDELSVPAG